MLIDLTKEEVAVVKATAAYSFPEGARPGIVQSIIDKMEEAHD